jgi:hypothetical protein
MKTINDFFQLIEFINIKPDNDNKKALIEFNLILQSIILGMMLNGEYSKQNIKNLIKKIKEN